MRAAAAAGSTHGPRVCVAGGVAAHEKPSKSFLSGLSGLIKSGLISSESFARCRVKNVSKFLVSAEAIVDDCGALTVVVRDSLAVPPPRPPVARHGSVAVASSYYRPAASLANARPTATQP